MTPYKSKSGKATGVTAFEIGNDSITVEFGGPTYIYNYQSAGRLAIEKMKTLAIAQQGLSTFISQNKPKYLRRIR